MFQDEADEDVVEAPLFKGQMEQVRHLEGDVAIAGGLDPGLGRFDRGRRNVDRDNPRLRAGVGQQDGLRTGATAAFQDAAAGRVGRVVVQKVAKGIRLVGQSNRFAAGMAVDIAGARHELPVCHATGWATMRAGVGDVAQLDRASAS